VKLGRVVGYVVSSRKDEGLIGAKLLIVRCIDVSPDNTALIDSSETLVAVDTVGAGVGETVIMTVGSSATKYVKGFDRFPTDTTILGIVDSAELPQAGPSGPNKNA